VIPRAALLLAVVAAALQPGCGGDATPERADDAPGRSSMTRPAIADVVRANTARLMAVEGVTGVAEGAREDGTPCILVIVQTRSPALEARIPEEIDGHPVEVRALGAFEARGDDDR
jgi:hypothetical protein